MIRIQLFARYQMVKFYQNHNYTKTILLPLILICSVRSIEQRCSTPTSLSNNTNISQNQCPEHSKCSNEGYCVCDKGFFGNCLNSGQYINAQSQQFNVNENISYFIIEPATNEFVSFQFTLCNQKGLQNHELLNLWVEDGQLDTPNEKNALGNNKEIKVEQGCMVLVTSFFSFTQQTNGQKELLILGVKLRDPGNVKITLLVQEIQLFGFDIIFKIILILVSGIMLVSLAAVIYCVYKCRRTRFNNFNEERNDIAFFEQYMPSQKTNLQQMKQEICSVCLAQFKQNEQIRHTVCSHYFHTTCLDAWCFANLSCPICRTSFEKADLIHHQYLTSSRASTTANERESIQNKVINQDNLRRPIV